MPSGRRVRRQSPSCGCRSSASRCRCCRAPTRSRSIAPSDTSRTRRCRAPTATPGIAGHRDGFFRGLKDIAADDVIELETHHGKEVYRVQRTWVVSPDDVSVLDPTPTRSLTLVTCYPFYFVGPAPERFIVRAVRVADSRPGPEVAERCGRSRPRGAVTRCCTFAPCRCDTRVSIWEKEGAIDDTRNDSGDGRWCTPLAACRRWPSPSRRRRRRARRRERRPPGRRP